MSDDNKLAHEVDVLGPDLSASFEALDASIDRAIERYERIRQQRDILFAAAKALNPISRYIDTCIVRIADLQRLAAAVEAVEQSQRDAAAHPGRQS